MTTLSFDPNNTLAGGLYSMAPREVVRLGVSLCDAVEAAVGADGCHGSIWPGNVTSANGLIALGPISEIGIASMSPDALEFVAPEQFWSGESAPESDVYSIGLLLYTALNGGTMPFFPPDGEHSADARATALQERMKGKPLPYPSAASRALGDVVLQATAFYAGSRYATPGQLKAALLSLPEGADLAAAAPVIPLSSEELKNTHSYKVDKDFEPTEPEKAKKPRKEKKDRDAVDENMDAAAFRATPKKKGRWILPLILIAVIIAAIILLLRGCHDDADPDFPISTAPIETAGLIHSPVPTQVLPAIEPTPEVPVESEAPEETEPPEEPNKEPVYEFYMADVTWEQAKDLCDQKGGHLATVHNEEQFNTIVEMAKENGASFVWLGAYRGDDSQWYYVTGDTLDYAAWDVGEPSAMDADGTREDYLLLWYRKSADTWSYNDMRNDPISVVPRTYSGKTAYVCQYDK